MLLYRQTDRLVIKVGSELPQAVALDLGSSY
jgi:hypothetical protein